MEFNIAKETKCSTAIAPEDGDNWDIQEIFGWASDPDANAVLLGQKYFNLPGYDEMLRIADGQQENIKEQ